MGFVHQQLVNFWVFVWIKLHKRLRRTCLSCYCCNDALLKRKTLFLEVSAGSSEYDFTMERFCDVISQSRDFFAAASRCWQGSKLGGIWLYWKKVLRRVNNNVFHDIVGFLSDIVKRINCELPSSNQLSKDWLSFFHSCWEETADTTIQLPMTWRGLSGSLGINNCAYFWYTVKLNGCDVIWFLHFYQYYC